MNEDKPFSGILISVHYNKIVAKPIEYQDYLKVINQIMRLLGQNLTQRRQST